MSGTKERHKAIHNAIWRHSPGCCDDDDCGLMADAVVEVLGSVRDQAVWLAAACTDEQLDLLRRIWADETKRRRSVVSEEPAPSTEGEQT